MTALSIPVPWYRQRWPWLLFARPAIVVVASFATLWLAASSDDGVIADDCLRRRHRAATGGPLARQRRDRPVETAGHARPRRARRSASGCRAQHRLIGRGNEPG